MPAGGAVTTKRAGCVVELGRETPYRRSRRRRPEDARHDRVRVRRKVMGRHHAAPQREHARTIAVGFDHGRRAGYTARRIDGAKREWGGQVIWCRGEPAMIPISPKLATSTIADGLSHALAEIIRSGARHSATTVCCASSKACIRNRRDGSSGQHDGGGANLRGTAQQKRPDQSRDAGAAIRRTTANAAASTRCRRMSRSELSTGSAHRQQSRPPEMFRGRRRRVQHGFARPEANRDRM